MNHKLLLILLLGIVFSCCRKKDCEPCIKCESEKKGRLVFYTNIPAFVDCKDAKVDIYVDSIYAGSISKATIFDTLTSCHQSNSTLVVEKDTGDVNYYAKISCGDMSTRTLTVKVEKGFCQKIHLDYKNYFSYNIDYKKFLLGNWYEVLYNDSIDLGRILTFSDNDTMTITEIVPESKISKYRFECINDGYSYGAVLNVFIDNNYVTTHPIYFYKNDSIKLVDFKYFARHGQWDDYKLIKK